MLPLIKHHVFREAERELISMIDSHKDRINDLRSATIMDELHETASQSELSRVADIELLDRFGDRLEQLENQLIELQRLDPHAHMEMVDVGAVVSTDHRNFIIGPSIEEFQVDGRTFQGLTQEAPLFAMLRSKRKGDQVVFSGVTYNVLDVR